MDSTRKRKTVYAIIEKPGKKSYWMRIGVAWLNQDDSWNVYLDAMPFDRKLQVRDEDLRPREKANGNDHTEALPPTLGAFDDIGGIQ
jgi:hypothetical protein